MGEETKNHGALIGVGTGASGFLGHLLGTIGGEETGARIADKKGSDFVKSVRTGGRAGGALGAGLGALGGYGILRSVSEREKKKDDAPSLAKMAADYSASMKKK